MVRFFKSRSSAAPQASSAHDSRTSEVKGICSWVGIRKVAVGWASELVAGARGPKLRGGGGCVGRSVELNGRGGVWAGLSVGEWVCTNPSDGSRAPRCHPNVARGCWLHPALPGVPGGRLDIERYTRAWSSCCKSGRTVRFASFSFWYFVKTQFVV